jgi:hypothetical protein
MIPTWEVTTVAKDNVQGLGGGDVNDQMIKVGGISIGAAQLGGPGVMYHQKF